MSQIPRDIDELMWDVAERDDPLALEEFGERYPDYRAEMVKRLNMVRGLRGSRPRRKATRFMPSPGPAAGASWVPAATYGLLLVATIYATWAVTTYYNRGDDPTPVATGRLDSRPPVNEAAPPTTGSTGMNPQDTPAPGGGAQAPQGPARSPEPTVPTVSPFDRQVTLNHGRIWLSDALEQIAVQAGVTFEFAPGMPNVEIVCQYDRVPAVKVLDDLGQNFGFTAVIQTDRTALLIPASDPGRPPADPGPGNFSGPVDAPGDPRDPTNP